MHVICAFLMVRHVETDNVFGRVRNRRIFADGKRRSLRSGSCRSLQKVWRKSLIYQILPSVASSLELRAFPSEPMVVVISPLNLLMRDQVTALQGRGIRAFQVGCSVEDDASIKNGECSIFFGSPELLIGRDEWRLALQELPLKDRVIAVVVDEVHTVIQW